MTQHYYGDLSNLNAPYDAVPLQGLGADDPKYPWKKNSKETLYLQQDVNEGLVAAGLCPIVEDGYLGPATCGAMQYLISKGAPFQMVSTCSERGEFVAPKSKPCVAGAAMYDPSAPPGSEANPIDLDAIDGGGSGKIPAWAIGVGVGVLAIGVALMLKKKKRR